MPGLTLTDVVAWWGAVVATFVAIWDVFTWVRRRAHISVAATPNMKLYPSPPGGGPSYISVIATNHGEQPTTITHLAGLHYPTVWHKLMRRGGQHFAVVNHPAGTHLPHVLGPGEQWRGLVDQAGVVKHYGTSGWLYCGVFHSLAKNGVYRRVRLR